MTWTMTTLGEVCKAGGGKIQTGPFGSQLHASDYVGAGIPTVMPQNIGDNRIVADGISQISEEDAARLGRHRLATNDIVYSRRGDVERRALIKPENEGWLCGTGCLRVIFGEAPVVNPAFISYYLGTQESRRWIVQHAVGATMLNLNTAILSNVPLRVPSIREQDAIAEVLGALDDKIAANTRVARAVEELGATLFQQVGLDCSSSDTARELSDLFEVNPQRPLRSDTATIIDMQALPMNQPLVSSWTEGPKKGGARFQNGDTLVARITPCLENRKTAFVDFLDPDEVGIGSTEFIVLRSKAGIPLGLSYFMAISPRFREFAMQHMVGTSGRQRVSASDIQRHEVAEVPHEALVEFGRWSDAHLKILGSHRSENRTLTNLRDTLLPQLMSGNLRVKDAEKVVEGAV